MAMFRPLLLVTYAVNYALGGHHPLGYYLVNLLLHVLVAAATARVTVFARNHTAGWWSGMLFALHPIQSQAVNYISARSELLSALGVLVAFLMAARNRASMATAASPTGGLLAKSSAVVLLPLLIAHRWLRLEPLVKRQLLLVAAATVCYLVISFAIGFLGGRAARGCASLRCAPLGSGEDARLLSEPDRDAHPPRGGTRLYH